MNCVTRSTVGFALLVTVACSGGGEGANSEPLTASATALTTDEDVAIAGTVQVVNGDSTTFEVATPPAHGTLAFTADGASFVYTPNPDYNGSDTATVLARDGDREALATVDLTIVAVDDPPTVTVPQPLTTTAGTPLVVSGRSAIRVSDVDAVTTTVALTVENGSVSLGGTDALTFAEGDGVSDETVRFSGSVEAVNEALLALTVIPPIGFTGLITVDVDVNEDDAPEAPQASDSFVVGVGNVDLPPTVTIAKTLKANAGIVEPVAGTSIADVDAFADTPFIVDLVADNGTLHLDDANDLTGDNDRATLQLTGTLATINAALAGLTFVQPEAGETTITLTVTSGELSTEGTCLVTVAPSETALPPSSADASFFAGKLEEIPFSLVAHGSGTGISVTSAVITECVGDTRSRLIIEGVTVDCKALPVRIPVIDNTTDTDDGHGLAHVFAGAWAPTAASLDGFSVSIRFSDSRTPPLQSDTYVVKFDYADLNTPPTLQFLADGSQAFEAGTLVDNTVHVQLQSKAGSAVIGYAMADAEFDASDIGRVFISGVGPTGATISLPDAPSGVVTVLTPGQEFQLDGTLARINAALATMKVTFSNVSAADYTIEITAHDVGTDGACSITDPDFCDKTAEANLQVSASSDAPVLSYGP